MDPVRWRKAGESEVFCNCPNHEDKFIFFARIYTVHRGFDYSETNNLISNFKKKPNSSSLILRYKTLAIERFAAESCKLFCYTSALQHKFSLVPVPPSKLINNPEFDDRVDRVARRVASLCTNVTYRPLLKGIKNRDPAHKSNEYRSMETIYESISIDSQLVSQYQPGTILVIFDDVTTSGASFEASRLHLQKTFPGEKIIGVIWAKAVEFS